MNKTVDGIVNDFTFNPESDSYFSFYTVDGDLLYFDLKEKMTISTNNKTINYWDDYFYETKHGKVYESWEIQPEGNPVFFLSDGRYQFMESAYISSVVLDVDKIINDDHCLKLYKGDELIEEYDYKHTDIYNALEERLSKR